MNSLAHLSDAQLQERLRRLAEDLFDAAGDLPARRFIQSLEAETRKEIAGRRESAELHVLHGAFASLVRADLAFDGCYGDEFATVHEAVVLVDDTESDEPCLLQCVKTDAFNDFYRWTPLAFGPVRERDASASVQALQQGDVL